MPTVEERLAHIEGRVAEQASEFTEIRESLRHLEHRMDAGFEQVERRFGSLDRRFEAIDRGFESMDAKFDAKFARVDARFEALEQKISRQFIWLTGMMVTGLIAVVGSLLARL